ncbi:substrate-binding domain-containing protein [Dyella sp. OK004]|uniref:substrate-binding domain-containing protein n=1 Tax=Dyella sp. OK004 TaxID=1855292 RepID=UPI0015A68B07|nr:substrate-binding domain-containing protein [Dyella sp. OK004]
MNKLAGALVLAIVASSAHAAIQVGGGATLPAVGYVGTVTHRLNASPDANSLLGAYKSVTGTPASYCQTGSGAGKNVLAGVTSVQGQCADSPSPTDFGAANALVNRTTLTQPNFAGSDSPLSTTDYTNYTGHRGTSRPLQFPAVAGGIAIVYRNDNLSTQLSLTSAQVCSIFNGTTTKWSQLGVAAPVAGDTIKVVYRADGSGTSFGFSNFLSANCSGTPAAHFKTDQAFSSAVSLYSLPGASWNGQSGNANVVNTIVNSADDGYIGYAEAANALAVAGNIALVNGKDPAADLGDATTHKVTINSADVVYNNAITGVDANTGRPTFGPISGAPTTSCIALVKPNAYATPAAGYPIVAVSYLLGSSEGNGADAANVRKLLGAPYNSSIVSATGTIGAGTGLAFLTAPITQTQIDGCVIN